MPICTECLSAGLPSHTRHSTETTCPIYLRDRHKPFLEKVRLTEMAGQRIGEMSYVLANPKVENK